MPTKAIVSQIGRNDFFSVLPPGFYMFLVIYCGHRSHYHAAAGTSGLFAGVMDLAALIKDQPALLLFILFACYLLGSICRALPVRWAEYTIPPFHCRFPYGDKLNEVLITLKNHPWSTKFQVDRNWKLGKKPPMHIFNYWKDFLCIASPEGFQFYQTFEVRSRLFAGIIWSAWFGISGAIYIILRTSDTPPKAGLSLLLLSLILLLTFGANFRRVREQEAQALLMIYLAYFHSDRFESRRPASSLSPDQVVPPDR